MLARLATGFVLAPLVVWLLLAGPLPLILAVLVLASAACAWELLGMWPDVRARDRALGTAVVALAVIAPAVHGHAPLLVATLAPVVLLVWCLGKPDDLPAAARRAMALLLALGYVGMLASCMTWVAVHTPAPGAVAAPFAFGPAALLSLFIIVFAGDTGAYFAGRFLGRHKLYPLVSPKKTIEGSVGGLLASVGGAALCSHLLIPQIPMADALVLGAGCGAVAQVGDLAESLFKRASGTKDSGNLLPGHGGMLDRLDGVLFAAPVFVAWLLLRVAT